MKWLTKPVSSRRFCAIGKRNSPCSGPGGDVPETGCTGSEDLRIVLAIKRLRQDEKYTLKGALERLREAPSLWRDSAVDKPAAAPGPAAGTRRDHERVA